MITAEKWGIRYIWALETSHIYTQSNVNSVAYQQKQSVSILGTDSGIYLIVFIYSNNPFIVNTLNSRQKVPKGQQLSLPFLETGFQIETLTFLS